MLTFSDIDRMEWVRSNSSLYWEWQRSKLPIQEYVRQNRDMINRYIRKVVSGRKKVYC